MPFLEGKRVSERASGRPLVECPFFGLLGLITSAMCVCALYLLRTALCALNGLCVRSRKLGSSRWAV